MAMTAAKSKIHAVIKPAAGILAAAVAITTTLNVTAAKYTSTQSYTAKALVLVSRIAGPGAASALANQTNTASFLVAAPPQGINPLGPLNTTTFTGVAVLIVDYIIHQFNVPYYSSYASPFIKALGVGLTAGGVVGGLLDPPGAAGNTGRTGGSGGFAFSNAALGRSVMGYTGVS